MELFVTIVNNWKLRKFKHPYGNFLRDVDNAWKVSICGVFSGPHFPVFGLNTGKYGTAKTLYLNTFHEVRVFKGLLIFSPSVAAAIDTEGEKTPPTI